MAKYSKPAENDRQPSKNGTAPSMLGERNKTPAGNQEGNREVLAGR